MKKILMALAIAGFTYFSAEAQATQEVCRISPKKGASCYKTKYAENYKVCKNNRGYFICGETPGYANSTHPKFQVPAYNIAPQYAMQDNYTMQSYNDNTQEDNTAVATDMIAPQSQSYPTNTGFGMNNANSYEGYYGKKNYIRVCYGGDNVAENNRNPYRGCPSPQDEGPAVNNARNINVSNPVEMPPVSGRIHD